MSIIDILKSFFSRKPQQKLLPEGRNNIVERDVNTSNDFKNNLQYDVKKNPTLIEPDFKECVEEYIKQYAIQEEIKSKAKIYHSFIRMFCDNEESSGNNKKNQEKLNDKIKKSGYQTAFQMSGNRCIYMYISGEKGLDEYKNRDMEKIYLNCERKNIALLTSKIFDEIKGITGDKLQMKCISEQFLKEGEKQEENAKIKNYQRNEKIVIYAENHEMAEKIAEKINQIRINNPELFSGNKTLPFMQKKYGVMGIGVKKIYEYAKTPLGEVTGKTYNEYIANLLYTCIIAGFDKEMGVDENNKESLEERMGIYSKLYSKMSTEQKASVMGNIKKTYEEVTKENNISTVYSKQSTDITIEK